MKNSVIKNDNQIILFNLIQKKLPANLALVDTVSDILGVGYDAVYRRMRGEKPISLEETIKLCRHFNISMNSFVSETHKTHIQCHYSPLHLDKLQDNLTFIQDMSENINNVKLIPGSEIILSAVDIPLFNIFPYRELTLFKFFSWSKSMHGYAADYELFIKEIEHFDVLSYKYEKIVKGYQLVPSSEIWMDNTIDTILRLLRYHFEMRHFSDEKTPLFLCEQLLDLINTLQKWVEKGTKGEENIPFKFYVSETDIANTYILFKNPDKSNCMVRLYTINALNIADEGFCKETEIWLQKSIQQATLISGASEIERFKFFNAQRKKINDLIDKIQS